jgi:hypothetical protein
MYVDITITIHCLHCGSPCEKPKGEVTRSTKLSKNLFCSISCEAKYTHEKNRGKKREEYDANPIPCEWCKSPIPYETKASNRFCCQSCAAFFTNSKRIKKPSEYFSLDCNEPIAKKAMYCSQNCSFSALRKKNDAKILTGEATNEYIRKYLIRTRGDSCELCGWREINPVTEKCPIQMDHIDGNWQNRNLDNLRLICPNCHSLTPTFGNLNRGKGRGYRYADKA